MAMTENTGAVQEFTEFTGAAPELWMLWPGWAAWVGCDRCAGDGPEAPCWGEARCHGYLNGCGCARLARPGMRWRPWKRSKAKKSGGGAGLQAGRPAGRGVRICKRH